MRSVDFFLSNADNRRAARGNFRTQKLPGLFSSVPSQPDKLVPLSLTKEFTQRKGFHCYWWSCCCCCFVFVLFISLHRLQKSVWRSWRIHGMTSSYAPSFLLNPNSLHRSLISTNLRLPRFFSISLQPYMQGAKALIMWTASSHGLWELSDHICWTPRPKTPNSTGMLFAMPFWSSVDWFSCSG